MDGGVADRRAYPPPGTPPVHRFHDHRRGRRSHVPSVPSVPRGRARTVNPQVGSSVGGSPV